MNGLIARLSTEALRGRRLSFGLEILCAFSTTTKATTAAQQSACMDPLGREKTAIRSLLKQNLRKSPLVDLQAESRSIAQRIVESQVFARSRRLGIYVHCPQLREVDTSPIIAAALSKGAENRCYVPNVEDRNSNMKMVHLDDINGLEAVPPFNILEPKPYYPGTQKLREDAMDANPPLDVLIMPGLGFDEAGRRLGRGGGYYDKFVSRCMSRAEELQVSRPLLVACSFRCQLVESIPTGEGDQDMDVIITPDRVLKCSSQGEQQWS